MQKKGVDFDEVFTPVTRLETLRLLVAFSDKNWWEVYHLDVKTAFLNVELVEEVYVSQPEGFEKKSQEHKVYKLLKALYGLRQAPRLVCSPQQMFKGLGFYKIPIRARTVHEKRRTRVLDCGCLY